jgi:type I restriction enzyme S subunit
MKVMQKVKISDLFNFEKWSLQSSKSSPWEYDFITAGSDRKTHEVYTHDCEALVFAMAASWSLWRMHYVKWKFIASDLCFIITPKNVNDINMKFYHIYFNLIREDIVKKTATWSAKLAINQTNFGNYEIIYCNKKQQDIAFSKIEKLQPDVQKFIEIIDCSLLIKSLRQSILSDAISGKLIPQDSSDESASVLLEKVKIEKAKLVAEKKTKSSKQFALIRDDEKPFELPRGWEWVKLGNCIQNSENLNIHTKLPLEAIINYVDIDAIDNQKYKIKSPKALKVSELSSRARRILKKWSILYSTVRPYLNNLAIIEEDLPNFIWSTGFVVFDVILLERKFIFYFLLSQYVKEYYMSFLKWFNSPSITDEQFKSILISLPPLAEQNRIVAKVDELMALCDKLETQIIDAQQQGKLLMESVLSEVME